MFLQPATTLPEAPFVIRCMGQERLRFTFDVVRIWELSPTLVAVASRIAAASVPRHEQSELIGLLALLSGKRLPRQMLAEALRREHMIQDLLSESSFAAAVYDVARAEGKTQGTTEGMRKLIRLTLQARFGALSADFGAALAAASEPTLEAMATGLATESLDQIRARLGLS